MSVDLENDLITVAEAAKLLRVSTVTISRWLKQGQLPAYRVGPRQVRIRRSDLKKMLAPMPGQEEGTEVEPESSKTRIEIRPLTDEEVQRRLKAIREAQDFTRRMRERRGGQPITSSWRLIREEREERSKQL